MPRFTPVNKANSGHFAMTMWPRLTPRCPEMINVSLYFRLFLIVGRDARRSKRHSASLSFIFRNHMGRRAYKMSLLFEASSWYCKQADYRSVVKKRCNERYYDVVSSVLAAIRCRVILAGRRCLIHEISVMAPSLSTFLEVSLEIAR